jgi:pimeloyl-ACP methyl ester carboxylesterase
MWLKKSVRLQIAGAYLILLIASHVVESTRAEPGRSPEIRTASVHVADHGRIQSRTIVLAYRDTAPESTELPVVLVHGSPGSGEVLKKLAALLTPQFRVIVPDLPGFGASAHDLPDYSFRAHGAYLVELLDALHIDRAQFVGFSMGGGVVLSVTDLAPRRVASIVMLSAIGVQEHELTGSYRANHFLHGAQLALLWTLKNGFPHFGLFWNVPLTVEYARNFYDSDQRPLRTILAQYRGPMLIIHGIRDRNVPIAAALEHHKLVPQSQMVELDDNHFMAFMHPSEFVDPLVQFLSNVR